MVINKKIYNLLLRGCFNTKGRARRVEYICRLILLPLLAYICGGFYNIFFYFEDNIIGIIFGIIAAFILTPLVAFALLQIFFVTHRRLHDLNASGWWQLITFIPLGQLMMIGFIFFKGTEGPNKYGPPPEY